MLGDGLDWGDKKEKKWADFAGTLILGSKDAFLPPRTTPPSAFCPKKTWLNHHDFLSHGMGRQMGEG